MNLYNKYIKNLALFALVFVFSFGSFTQSVLAAYTWTERQPAGDVIGEWFGASSDSDGSNLIVSGALGRIYTSADSGANWTERQPAGDLIKNWYGIASDDDGSNLIAAAYAGRIYTSSDGGANWTERQPAGDVNGNWFAVASDSDGSNLIVGGDGRLYTSSDGGANWTERQPAGDLNKSWYAISSDNDGSNLIVGSYSGRLYTSSDGGANWTERQPAGDVNRNWWDAASDSDGSNLIVSGASGRIYTSSDSGANWTERQILGDLNKSWETVASNADGSVLLALNRGAGGRVYVSIDGGANWTEEQPAGNADKNWVSSALDSDGSNLLVGHQTNGRLYSGVVVDAVAPTVSTLNPVDDATGISTTANLVITFDEAVDVETGDIVIYKANDDSIFETIPVGSGNVTGTGTTTITIDPTGTLVEGTSYYVQIAATAFDDTAGNSYAGITDETTWNFSTESAPVVESSNSSGSRPSSRPPSFTPPSPNSNATINNPNTNISTIIKNYVFTRTLRNGSVGEDVKELQKYLNANGFTVAITGNGSVNNETIHFGPRTRSALMLFQKSKGLVADGIIGPITRGVINGN